MLIVCFFLLLYDVLSINQSSSSFIGNGCKQNKLWRRGMLSHDTSNVIYTQTPKKVIIRNIELICQLQTSIYT